MASTVGRGTVLNGRYCVLEVLGRGGMSTVYLAKDQKLGFEVAVKRLDVHRLGVTEARQVAGHFEREARMLACLDHEGLVHVLDFFLEEGLPHLVTAFVKGRDLQRLVESAVHRLAVETVLDWADQICAVLEYLHRHDPPVIFRDLKPANVMLGDDGRVRLIDFGIARLFSPHKETTALLRGFGTPGYAPLEQYRGGTDPRSDVYALGATVYFLLTAQAPPDAVALAAGDTAWTPPSRLNNEVWPALDQVVYKMMAVSRERRYPSAADARRALREARPRELAAGAGPVQFCPHRDLPPAPNGWRARNTIDPFRFLSPCTVVWHGHRQGAEAVLSGVEGAGLAALAIYHEPFAGIVPGHWMVLVLR